MIKKKSFTLQAQEKKSAGWAKFQEWNRKWNKIMSLIFCALIFALLFAIVVVNTTSANANHEADEETINNGNGKTARADNTTTKQCKLYTETTDYGDMCDFNCEGAANFNLTEDMEIILNNTNTNCISGYHLRYDKPSIQKLSHGWLTIDAIINKITIRDNGTLEEIEPGAFNDCIFRGLTELVIKKSNIKVLERGVFEGIIDLKKLTLEENGNMQIIDEYTLDPLYRLEELTIIKQTKIENLRNITGTTQFRHLRKLILSDNDFGSTIDYNTFRGCTRIEILNLSNSSIRAIGIGSFDYMIDTILFLDLSNNLLNRLPANLLVNLDKPNMQLYLSYNKWHCDCESLELQWYDNSSLIKDSPLKCEMPQSDVELRNVDLNICEESTSMTTSSTTSVTTVDTTVDTTVQPPLDRLKCNNNQYSSEYIYMERAYCSLNIKQVAMGKVMIETTSSDPNLSVVLMNDQGEAECRYDFNKQMIFDNLNTNSAHIFCLIRKTSSATSPKNCFAFHFNERKSIWGHDEIIIALVCSIVLSLVIGVLIGWLLSCRYQRHFKARETLQYQSSASSSSKTISEDFNSSVASDYHGKFSLDSGTNLRRTYSDNSIISCKSYITAVTPSPFEIIQWKLRKNAMNPNEFHVRDYLDKLDYDCLPPPLPPHPNRRHSNKIYETVGEPVYTCTSEIVPYRITYSSSISKDINI